MALWSHLQYFVKERLTVGSIYEVRIYYYAVRSIYIHYYNVCFSQTARIMLLLE